MLESAPEQGGVHTKAKKKDGGAVGRKLKLFCQGEKAVKLKTD
jgi:hypothetical protein